MTQAGARPVPKPGWLQRARALLGRPGLHAFLRRQLARVPLLDWLARAAVARSRRARQSLPVVDPEDAGLTDRARQLLQDLQRAIDPPAAP